MLCVGNFQYSIDSYNIFLHTHCFGYPELIFLLKTCFHVFRFLETNVCWNQSSYAMMSTYLLGRQQCVRLEGVCSNFKTVKSGVPQRSLLGPLRFNIFINDLNFWVPNVSLRLYADDTTAYLSDVSPTILEFSFNKDLQTLSSWFESNHLTVNSTKTQALSVGPCAYHYSLFLNNARTEFLRSIKILGVTLDKDLSYEEHISDQLKILESLREGLCMMQ